MLTTDMGCDVCGFGSVENVEEFSPIEPCRDCGTVAREASADDAQPETVRVWSIFGGRLRLFESGDVRYWDRLERRWCSGWGRFVDERIEGDDQARHDAWGAASEAYRLRPPL